MINKYVANEQFIIQSFYSTILLSLKPISRLADINEDQMANEYFVAWRFYSNTVLYGITGMFAILSSKSHMHLDSLPPPVECRWFPPTPRWRSNKAFGRPFALWFVAVRRLSRE
jgi:hypothetical protein